MKILKKIVENFYKIMIKILFLALMLIMIYTLIVKINKIFNKNYMPMFSIHTVISPSMLPTLRVYDIIVVKKVNNVDDLKVGDIITFKLQSRKVTITHRIDEILIDNNSKYFITKGDNNPSIDDEKININNVLGEVVMILPYFGYIQLFIQSKIGWIMIVLIPASLIIIKNINKIKKIEK